MANERASTLFGFETPEQVRQRIGKTEQAEAAGMFSGGLNEQIFRAAMGGGQMMGRGIAEAAGYEAPEVSQAKLRQSLISSVDLTDRNQLIEAARVAGQSGDIALQTQLADRALKLTPKDKETFGDFEPIIMGGKDTGLLGQKSSKTGAYRNVKRAEDKGININVTLPTTSSAQELKQTKLILDQDPVLSGEGAMNIGLNNKEKIQLSSVVANESERIIAAEKAKGNIVSPDDAKRQALQNVKDAGWLVEEEKWGFKTVSFVPQEGTLADSLKAKINVEIPKLIRRKMKDGRTALFDENKQFVRYE
jgi:hypothetical protein